MDSFVPFPNTTVSGTTTTVPTVRIQPKPEPVDEDSLIAPPGIPVPPEIHFPRIETPSLPRESRPGTMMFNHAFSGEQNLQNDVGFVNNERAIVPVPENQILFVSDSNEYHPRSNELVRVTDLSSDDQFYYRGIVRKTRMLFDSVRILSTADKDKRLAFGIGRRVRGDLKAGSLMRLQGLWLYLDKRIVGSIPGVEIGDVFSFRTEMCVIGLHGQNQAGIDFLPGRQSSNKEPIATSIVFSAGYEGDVDEGDVITYSGHGGLDKNLKQGAHQKLEGGNLALERSMRYGIEVRVVRGFKYDGSLSGRVYVYDGLYNVSNFWFEVDSSGFGVFKYRLVRLENQPRMGSESLRFAQALRIKPLTARPGGYLCLDISMRQENVPVLLCNNIDDEYEPLEHQYLVKSIIPPYVYQFGSNNGCNCVYGCSEYCFCASKNGGEFAYDEKGILIHGKPVIFECGPSCTCPPTCRNRVSQKGVRHRLEVFRSSKTGWGVRSLDLIHAGSFLCEYAGVFLTRQQAAVVSMSGDNLLYPRRFSEKWIEWGDLSQVLPNYIRPLHPSIPPLDFAIDVSCMRNVACYISHSPSPNVMVQFVLYDHNNVMFPRLMLFAMETIPPLRDFSLDYGVAHESSPKLAICN